jgi:cobaltochelatase CobS
MEGEASELMKKAQELLKEAEKKREEKRRKEEEERRKREQETQKNNRHYMTDEVVKRLKCLGKAFLVGPAGTGKSTLAMCACREIFGIEGPVEAVVKSGKFAQISFSPDTVSADMLGFTDVNGVFHETEIIRVFRDGGLILFDEMDDADASLLVKLNTMLANRVIPIPGGVVTQNEECYIVGTANTYGKGGNSMYVGRSRLDAATLDRWKMSTIDVDYDVKLEEGIIARTIGESYPQAAKELTIATRVIRERIQANKWKQICSTRFVIDGCKMVAAGYSIRKVLDTYLLDWDDNSRRLVNSAIRDAFKAEGK